MKRIVIILSGILLTWNTGVARNVQYTVFFKVDSLYSFMSKVDSGKIVQPLAHVKNGYILDGWFDENDKLYNFDGLITTDSVMLTAKWSKVEDIKSAFISHNNSNNYDRNVLESIKQQVNMLFIAVIALAVLLVGLLLYVFLVLNNRKRFRDCILKELEHCPQGGKMEKYQKSIVEKAIEGVKPLLNANSSKSSDNKTACAIEDLQRRIATLEDSKRSSSISVQPAKPVQPQSLTLYADSIFDGKFNRVRETPNEDTIFELKLSHAGDTRAYVVVYREAYRKVIANPAYLEGCEKQILGNNTVKMQREGVATKDDSGNWIISKKPEVQIS